MVVVIVLVVVDNRCWFGGGRVVGLRQSAKDMHQREKMKNINVKKF